MITRTGVLNSFGEVRTRRIEEAPIGMDDI